MTNGFCEACGAPRLSHHMFCTSCGASFADQDSQSLTEEGEADAFISIAEVDPKTDEWIEEADLEGYKSNILPTVLVVALIALLIGAGGWFLWQQSNDEQITVRVTGPANIRDMPTAEGSQIVGRLDAGDELEGNWVEGANDPNVDWLQISGSGEPRFVWGGNLQPIGSASVAASGTPSTRLSDQIVGRWRCSSTALGIREEQVTEFNPDGTIEGRSTLSGTLEGQRVTGNANYFGKWRVNEQMLTESIESYQISNFQWSNPLVDAILVSELEQAQMEATQSATIEMGQDQMRLLFEVDGLLAPVSCERA